MTWTPERAGNWLFHCHMMVHMTPHMNLPGADPAGHIEHEAAVGMGGLVLGIRVTGVDTKVPVAAAVNARHLRLILRERSAGMALFGLELQDPASAAPKTGTPLSLIGPLIVLTRGQPAEIEVVNTPEGPCRNPLARD